jgi:hypothetical protein
VTVLASGFRSQRAYFAVALDDWGTAKYLVALVNATWNEQVSTTLDLWMQSVHAVSTFAEALGDNVAAGFVTDALQNEHTH